MVLGPVLDEFFKYGPGVSPIGMSAVWFMDIGRRVIVQREMFLKIIHGDSGQHQAVGQ
jgi:hypothetical protein